MTSRSAGRSAQARYERLARQWRGRAIAPVRWLLIPAGSVVFLIEVVAGRSTLDWSLGIAMGAVCALYIALRDSPPAYIENWRTGAQGERRTARALARLPRSDWRVVHDRAGHRSNRDHVVAGPGGVFLLDSKWLGGHFTVEGEVARVERLGGPASNYDMPRIAPATRAGAAALKRDLEAAGARVPWVRAVVVVWGEFPQGIYEGDRITYVQGSGLVRWLEAQPRVYDAALIERVAERLAELPAASWATQLSHRR